MIPRTVAALTILLFLPHHARCCTNVLVTPGASLHEDAMISYNADSGDLMGLLYHYPATNRSMSSSESYAFNDDKESDPTNTTMRKVYDWDTGKYLGEIPEANTTYNVVGNTNEYGLVIAETTFGGISSLSNQPGAIIDYGSLIYITLQRSQTARDAIRTMSNLMDTYGYASEGESFSIADRHGEVWIMEVIGRGPKKVGAVWVAMRIPDGYVSSHANQARIRTFPRDDPERCMYADDVVEFAVEMGLYDSTKNDENDDSSDFSFSDTYDPVTFSGARWCDARVWSVFGAVGSSDDDDFISQYEDYASGKNLTNRMPLWIKPKHKLSLKDVMTLMANHYESTSLEFDNDVGAGPYKAPYRPHPLLWKYEEQKYMNERSISTQQTGWNFVAQIRGWMPRELSSILWFGVDDSATSPRYPVYGSSTSISSAYGGMGPQDGVPQPLLEFDLKKAFWVQNMVSNLAYTRWYDIYPHIRETIATSIDLFLEELEFVDDTAQLIYDEEGPSQAVEYVTNYSVTAGDMTHNRWLDFYGDMFVRFRDGYEIVADPNQNSCGCDAKENGFSQEWKQRIADETQTRYEVPSAGSIGVREIDHHTDVVSSIHDDLQKGQMMMSQLWDSSVNLVLEKNRMEHSAKEKLQLKSLW